MLGHCGLCFRDATQHGKVPPATQHGVQAGIFKDSANRTIVTVEAAAAAGGTGDVDITELTRAQTLLEEAQDDLIEAERATREATDDFGGVIIFIGVCAIICAILGLLCVFVRVRSPFSCRVVSSRPRLSFMVFCIN